LMAADTFVKYFTAGGVGAMVSHAGAVPLDVVKTRVQQDPARFEGLGVAGSASALVADEGIFVLARGLGSTVAGYLLHGGFKYGGFEWMKYALFHSDVPHLAAYAADHRLQSLLFAAFVAELVATVALCPLEQARIKTVSDASYAGSFVGAVSRLVAEDGLDGIFRSLPPIYAKTIPFSMCQLAIYDWASTGIAAATASAGVEAPALLAKLPASFLAAFIAGVASQPGDVLLSVMNEEKGTSSVTALGSNEGKVSAARGGAVVRGEGSEERTVLAPERAAAAAAVAVAEREDAREVATSAPAPGERSARRAGVVETAVALGPARLFAGWWERLAHVSAVIVIQLLCYDEIKRALIQ